MSKIRAGRSDYLDFLGVKEEAHLLLNCSQPEDKRHIDKSRLRPFVLTIEGPKGLITYLGHNCEDRFLGVAFERKSSDPTGFR